MNKFKVLCAISMLVVTAYSYAGRGNSTAAKLCQHDGWKNLRTATKLCQHDGWKNLRTATGGSFSNTGDCVSYSAHGGMLFAPSIIAGTLTCHGAPSMMIGGGGTSIMITIPFNASGYTPGAVASGTLSDSSFATTPLTSITPTNFGSSGSSSGAINGGVAVVTVLSNTPILSGEPLDLTISDSNGISTSITVNCP